MKKYLSLFAISLFLIGLWSCAENKPKSEVQKSNPADKPYVVMLSMDGFRWDYADSVATPNLDYIAQHGVKAEYMIPSFPTITFPNHYTLATGLYPNSHGLVFNSFHCPEINKDYSISNRKAVEDPEFYGGEPIWNTAEKQGVKTASFFWVGSETPVCGCQPTTWKKYQHNFPFEQRIDSVVSWLQLPLTERPHLITWYMHEPDATGHKEGPHSEATDKVVMHLDSLVGVFIQKVQALPIANKVNIIIVSDHGMCPVSPDRWIILNTKIKDSWVERINGYSPTLSIVAKPACVDSVYQALSNFEHIKYWKSEDVPKRLHFGSNPRIGDIVVVADSSWSVDYEKGRAPRKGNHGFDNKVSDMRAIFYAIGPAFKQGYTQAPFENVDIYPLIADIMKLTPAPTDGGLKAVKGMLRDSI